MTSTDERRRDEEHQHAGARRHDPLCTCQPDGSARGSASASLADASSGRGLSAAQRIGLALSDRDGASLARPVADDRRPARRPRPRPTASRDRSLGEPRRPDRRGRRHRRDRRRPAAAAERRGHRPDAAGARVRGGAAGADRTDGAPAGRAADRATRPSRAWPCARRTGGGARRSSTRRPRPSSCRTISTRRASAGCSTSRVMREALVLVAGRASLGGAARRGGCAQRLTTPYRGFAARRNVRRAAAGIERVRRSPTRWPRPAWCPTR